MKRKTLRRLRLSPNEESQLIREEQDRRRKIRIQQVREQARANALHIRSDVQRRREQELQLLAEELRQAWELQQREKIQALQRLYEESLRLLGQGHRSAKENEPDWEAMAQHAEENQVKAKQRYREALKELTSQRHREQEEHNRPADARRKALQAERQRAAWVASLPPPPPHPMETMEENRPPAGRSNVSGFSATHHHCPEPTVDREVAATQPDAHEEAQQEARRLLERGSEAERQREEQQETARLRGRSALKREQLTQDRERLVVELEHMQQTELLRRRQQVAQMPAQIFQPLHRRREAREDGQRDMEFAFEDMYTGERRVKGDLVLQLVPEPLPAPSTTSSQDQELDVTVDDGEDTPPEVTPETEAGHRGNGQHPGPATARVEPPQPAHRQALRKLLNRIRAQRDKGWDQGRDQPQEPDLISSAAACQPDEEPERDSSIDTGSLSVEEHGREASSPQLLPEPASVSETTGEESVLAPLPPEVLSSRMHEWKEREAALEREKRQQMVLLEDLEEQKSRLEAMLRDAQRERQDMQAAVNQDVSPQAPEVPAHDQEATSNAPPPAASELEGSTGKDQSGRIRQHQQRLLEKNRVHQQSVVVARQRLEQYQRALRLRHSAGVMARPPAGPPAGLAPRPPLGLSAETAVQVATPPAPVPRPTVPASAPGEIPARRSDPWRTPPPPRRPDLRPAPSLAPDPTRFPQGSPEDDANGPPPARRAGLSAWLTDSIMERATGHLPESLRSPPAAPNPFTHCPLGTAENVTAGVRPSSRLDAREPRLGTAPVPLLGPAAPQPGQASAQPRSFPRGHPVAQASLGPGTGDVERQRFELLEARRRTQEQREEVAQQLREQEEEQRRREAERCSHEAHQRWEEERCSHEAHQRWEEERCSHEAHQRWEEESRRKVEEERCTQEEQQRQEEQRRLEEERRRREELQREEEEQKRHDEEQREQMRRQREALQALINTETQGPRACPVAEPAAAGEEEEVGRSRLSLLSSLLRAIEESHGGSLSHLEEQPQPAPCTPSPPASDPAPLRGGLPSQSWGAARAQRPPLTRVKLGGAQRPPLTRVKLGAMVTLPGQHELSAIQEVETPGERSLAATGPEDVFGSQTLAAEGAPGSWDRHQRPGALQTDVDQRSAVCSDSELSTELSWKKRLLEQPPETEPGPSRPSWGPSEQPLAAVGAPGSRDRHQRPGALLTHVEERSAVCSDSELSTELSWKKRLLEQPPETEPGPSRPSWGQSEQPLAAVGAPGSRDRHQRPGALQTHVEERSAVCSDSELSTELSWRKRLLEQPHETEPGPSRASWGPSEQPLPTVGAPGSRDGHQRPGALLTHVEQKSAVCSDSELSTELSWRKRQLEQPPETGPGPSRPSSGPSEQPLAAVGAPGSRDGHQRPGALQTHVDQRSAVCSDSELSTELSWRKRLLEHPPETEPRPSWGPSEQPLAAVGAPGSRDRHQRPGALLTHVETRSAVCSPLPDSELSTELSWRKRLLEHPPETEPVPFRPSSGSSEQPLAAVGAPGSRDRHQRPGTLLTHVEERSAVCSDSELSTELSWKKRLLEHPPETEPCPSRPSWGPSEQPLAAVGAPGSRDRHQRPGALQTHVEQRSAVCSDSELSTELSWKKRLLEQPPETEPGPSWGPSEQPLAAVGAPGSRDRHQRPGALQTHVDQRSAVCSPLPASELSTELSWRKRLLEHPPETEPGPSEQPLAAEGAPGSRDRHHRPGALLTHVDQRSAVCSESELSTELSWKKRQLEQPPETEPVPSRPSWGPSEQPLAAVGAPGSRDRHQRPGALLTHVDQRSAVCSPLPDSELSTELSWRKRQLEQPPETEPGPSRPSWGPSEQPLAAVGAPGSRDGHQRPGALLTHVEQRSAVCSDSELSTELSWKKRLLEQPPETEPGPSEQPLAAEGAPGSRDRHHRPGALLTHVDQRSAVCSESELSTELSWKKRLLEQPPETEPGPSRPSWGPSEQAGRSSGSSVSPGSVGSGYTANSESAGRPAYPDSFSSSSLSTGSYVTTDPEHNSAHTDVSEPHSGPELIRPVTPTDGFLAAASPPSAPSSRSSCSVALSSAADSSSPGPSFSTGPQTSPGSEASPCSEASPGRAVAALLHESSIQRIIDKYTRELNASLCSSADTTGSSIALEENQVPPSPAQVPTATPPSETAPPRPGLEWDNAVNQILEQFSESVSLVQDLSFRPLIGQQDQSSCLAADGRHSAVGRLIGQPSAQSSMIGQLPGPSVRAGANEGAWDSTLSRMIDRLSHQPCSLWSSGGRDFYSSPLMGRLGLERSSVSFDEAQEDSRMRPLIGQLDESGVTRPGSAGGLGGSVGPTGSDPVQVLGDPPAPESPPHRPPPHQPSSHWPSSGPDRYASQLIGQPGLEETSLWLDAGPEEGGMKPLIGQSYDSAVQAAGSSGEGSSSSSSLGSVESVLVAPPPPPPPPASLPSAPLCPPHQPSAPQPSDGQLVRRLEFDQSSLWLDDGREEGGMRPLIGRLDESGGAQAAGSSGYGSSRAEQTRLNRGPHDDGTGGSPQAAVDPDLSAVPEPEVPDTRRRTPLQDPECSEGFADQDSFHPLLAQVTLNESLEPSMTFHLPQQEVPSSPDGSHQSTGREEAPSAGLPLAPHLSEEEDQGSVVDPSPEHPRAQEEEEWEEEVPISSCLDSFCQLASSQPPSVLLESPEEGEEPMVGEGDETDGCKRLVPARDSTSQEPTNQPGSNLKSDAPFWDTITGTAWGKGILEQSEITLVSLSDDSTLGPDTTATEDEDQEVDSTLLPEEEDPPAAQESPPSQPGVVLEPQAAGPAGGLQEAFQRKRLALIQRSALRVEEIRAKRVLAKTQPSDAKGTPPQPSDTRGTPPQPGHTQGKPPQPSDTRGTPPQLTQAKTQSVQNRAKTKLIPSPTGPHLGPARPEDHPRCRGQAPGHLVSSKTKEAQIKTMAVPLRTAVVPASRPDGKPKHPSPVSNAGMKGWGEVRTCTPSQKKLEGLEMHVRTRRLYGRLEEVKQQREVKSKQESYAQNRLKAKEFHQKTLQKLRAKQTAQ